MKRPAVCLAAVLCLGLLLASTALARTEGSGPKPPTINLAAANRYLKDWATKSYVEPRVFEAVINQEKVKATFTLEKIEPCRYRGKNGLSFYQCSLKVHDLIQQENDYEQETTVHEPVEVIVDEARHRKLYEGGGNFPVGVYPLRNPYRVFVVSF